MGLEEPKAARETLSVLLDTKQHGVPLIPALRSSNSTGAPNVARETLSVLLDTKQHGVPLIPAPLSSSLTGARSHGNPFSEAGAPLGLYGSCACASTRNGIGGVRSSRAKNKKTCTACFFIFAVTEPPQSPVFCEVPQIAVLRKKCAQMNEVK
jgi:hypothetical protein